MVKVKKNLCIGCGACVATCPQAFEMGGDGKAHVKDEGADADCVTAAAAGCPVSAIEL